MGAGRMKLRQRRPPSTVQMEMFTVGRDRRQGPVRKMRGLIAGVTQSAVKLRRQAPAGKIAAGIGTNSTILVGLVVLCPSQRTPAAGKDSRERRMVVRTHRLSAALATTYQPIVGYSGVHGDSTCHTGAGASPAPRRPSYDLARLSGRVR